MEGAGSRALQISNPEATGSWGDEKQFVKLLFFWRNAQVAIELVERAWEGPYFMQVNGGYWNEKKKVKA